MSCSSGNTEQRFSVHIFTYFSIFCSVSWNDYHVGVLCTNRIHILNETVITLNKQNCNANVVLLMWCDIRADANPRILSFVSALKYRLADIIEPDFGLLDELLRLEVLSRREYNKVRSGDKAAYERSDAVLNLLISENQCDKFLKALQRTHQQHVVNFITQNGG